MNSTLGSVVPLAMFILHRWKRKRNKLNGVCHILNGWKTWRMSRFMKNFSLQQNSMYAASIIQYSRSSLGKTSLYKMFMAKKSDQLILKSFSLAGEWFWLIKTDSPESKNAHLIGKMKFSSSVEVEYCVEGPRVPEKHLDWKCLKSILSLFWPVLAILSWTCTHFLVYFNMSK